MDYNVYLWKGVCVRTHILHIAPLIHSEQQYMNIQMYIRSHN